MGKTLEGLKAELAALVEAAKAAHPKVPKKEAKKGEGSEPPPSPAQAEGAAQPQQDGPQAQDLFLSALAEFAKDLAAQFGVPLAEGQSIFLDCDTDGLKAGFLLSPPLPPQAAGTTTIKEQTSSWLEEMVEKMMPPTVEEKTQGGADKTQAGTQPPDAEGGPPQEPEGPASLLIPAKKKHKPSVHDLGEIEGFEVWKDGKIINYCGTPKLVLQHFGVPITDIPCRQIVSWAKKNPVTGGHVVILYKGEGFAKLSEEVKKLWC